MSSVVIAGDTSGSVTLQAPAIAGSTVLTLPATSGTIALTSGSSSITTPIVNSTTSLSLQTNNGTNALVLDASQNATFAKTINASNTFGFKNRLINGNMQIWQRGTSGTASGYNFVSVDRWAGGPFSAYQVLSQSASVPNGGSQYSLKVQRTASQTNTGPIIAMQVIESTNCYDLSGQQVTLSFWAKAGANFSASSSFLNVQVATGTTADQGGVSYYSWTGAANPINSGVTLTTTWTKYTLTGTFGVGVLEAAALLYFTPTGTAGADDSFYITQVQLEVGSQATSFDQRSIGTETALCQRYYYKVSAGGYQIYAIGTGYGTTSTRFCLPLPVTLRAAVSSWDFSAANTFLCEVGNGSGTVVPTATNSTGNNTQNTFQISLTVSGATSGSPYNLYSNGTASYIGVGAEL